jgi:hypothetical protein
MFTKEQIDNQVALIRLAIEGEALYGTEGSKALAGASATLCAMAYQLARLGGVRREVFLEGCILLAQADIKGEAALQFQAQEAAKKEMH